MKKLINTVFSGRTINTSKGKLTFDEKGVCLLEDEVADAFKDITGFAVENDVEILKTPDDDKDPDNTSKLPENSTNASNNDDKDEDENINLDSLPVPSLKKYAKEHGVDINGLTTKEPILKAIKEALKK